MASARPRRRSSPGDGRSDCKPLHPIPSQELGYGGGGDGVLMDSHISGTRVCHPPAANWEDPCVATGSHALSTLIQELWFEVVANQQVSGLRDSRSSLAGWVICTPYPLPSASQWLGPAGSTRKLTERKRKWLFSWPRQPQERQGHLKGKL